MSSKKEKSNPYVIQPIHRVLIANRGEIAVRIIRTCHKLGLSTLAVYSVVDRDAPFVRLADSAICIGAAEASESYLNIEAVIDAAKKGHADAIHPGYGFLSENAAFATACAEAGINFIGPTPRTIALLGNKAAVKTLLEKKQTNIPLIPGYNGKDQSHETLIKEAKKIGFPVLIKAAAGGGGKGMRAVYAADDLIGALDSVKREAASAFGNDEVILEKYFVSVRHIEVQIFGDLYGNVVHFGERDCSAQRRFQKVIEEAPSPHPTISELRDAMTAIAVTIGELCDYHGAGTVEFLLDTTTDKYYFLEVNTRLQVEHPITELVYDIDLVQLQIEVAEGRPLKTLLADYHKFRRGHAIECRLYAEDPNNNFFPCTGKLHFFEPHDAEHVRYDTGVASGNEIGVHYDPMLTKIISFGKTRELAIARMIRALVYTAVVGLTTNKEFLLKMLKDEMFQSGVYDTGFIPLRFPSSELKARELSVAEMFELSVVAALQNWNARRSKTFSAGGKGSNRHYIRRRLPSGWSNGGDGSRRVCQFWQFKKQEKDISVAYTYLSKRLDDGIAAHVFRFQMLPQDTKKSENSENPLTNNATSNSDHSGSVAEVIFFSDQSVAGNWIDCQINSVRKKYYICSNNVDDEVFVWSSSTESHLLKKCSRFSQGEEGSEKKDGVADVKSPIPCRIVKVCIEKDQDVHKGDLLLILESMKMEMKVYAPQDGTITQLHCQAEQIVKEGIVLCTITKQKNIAKL